MQPIVSREVLTSVRCSTLAISSESLSPIRCLNCAKTLDIHQPDADLPYQMLATCDACKRWHIVDYDPVTPIAFLTLLPDTQSLIEKKPVA